ncbi:MAG: hypothetical protein NVS3B27_13040 [Novosphingobium sp.]
MERSRWRGSDGCLPHFLFRLLAGHGHRPAWTSLRMITVWIVSTFASYAGSKAGYFGMSSAVTAPLAVQGYIWLSYMPQGRVADHACKGSTFKLEKSFPALFNFSLTIQHALALYF